jgi:hypothetical protein
MARRSHPDDAELVAGANRPDYRIAIHRRGRERRLVALRGGVLRHHSSGSKGKRNAVLTDHWRQGQHTVEGLFDRYQGFAS